MPVQEAEALVNITIAFCSVLGAIATLIAALTWRLAVGLKNRDNRLESVEKGLKAHLDDCGNFRKGIDKRLEAGNEHFGSIERSLGRIEGAMGLAHSGDDAG